MYVVNYQLHVRSFTTMMSMITYTYICRRDRESERDLKPFPLDKVYLKCGRKNILIIYRELLITAQK